MVSVSVWWMVGSIGNVKWNVFELLVQSGNKCSPYQGGWNRLHFLINRVKSRRFRYSQFNFGGRHSVKGLEMPHFRKLVCCQNPKLANFSWTNTRPGLHSELLSESCGDELCLTANRDQTGLLSNWSLCYTSKVSRVTGELVTRPCDAGAGGTKWRFGTFRNVVGPTGSEYHSIQTTPFWQIHSISNANTQPNIQLRRCT